MIWRYDIIWYDIYIIWYDIIWYDMIYIYNIIWYDIIHTQVCFAVLDIAQTSTDFRSGQSAHTPSLSPSLLTLLQCFGAARSPPHPHPSGRGAFSSSPQSMTLASCQLLSITSNLWSGEKFVCEEGRTHAKAVPLSAAATVLSPADAAASEFTQMSSARHRTASATAAIAICSDALVFARCCWAFQMRF